MVKASLCYLGASAALALLLTAGNASAQDFIQELAPATNSYHKFFGEALAVDGDTAVMGDYNYMMEGDCGHQEHGAVQVLKKVNGVWQKAEFFRYPAQITDIQRHGYSVAIKGNVIVTVTPGQHWGSGSNQRQFAGALTVYKRPSASGTFTSAGQIFLPTPEAGDFLGWPAGMASNGVYAAVTSDKHRADIRIFNVQTMQYVTTIHHQARDPQGNLLDVPPWRMFITNQNILVVDSGGFPTPFAWKLNGSTVTAVDTSMLGDPFSDSTTGKLTGDGDSIAWISRYSGTYLLRTAKFNASAVVSNTVQYTPADHDPAPGSDSPITLEEGKGLFLANNSAGGPFVSSYKWVGDRYRYQGILMEGTMNFRSLAFNGTDLLIGDREPHHTLSVPCDGGFGSIWVYRPLSATAQGPGASTSLRPWMSRRTSSNGQAVATNGTYAVSAAPWTYQAASTGGAVLLYQNVNGVWDQVEEYLDSRNAGLGSGWSLFGAAVDVSSTAIVIGAPYGMNPWGNSSGNVQLVSQYNGVFRNGPYLDTIDTPNPQESGEGFGNAVALSGNTLFVGAPGWGVPPESPNKGGNVYVYNWDGFNWMWRQQLRSPTIQEYENFGYRVAASGDNLIVGIPGRSSGGHYSNGAIQIYRKDTSTGNFVSVGEFLAPSQLGDYANFGDAVTMGADFAAAGSSSGTAVIYRRSGTNWTQGTIITPGQGGFGSSLAIEGTNLVVGSPWENRVHRYTRGTTTWNRVGTLVGGSSSSFGSSLDMINGSVMIGEQYASVSGSSTGLSHLVTFSNIR